MIALTPDGKVLSWNRGACDMFGFSFEEAVGRSLDQMVIPAEVLDWYSPRLILMDIQLPGMDGLELTRRLKADPSRRGIVVVALTAYAMRGDQEKAFAAGCDGYITKPIDVEAFPRLIAAHLMPKVGCA